MASPLSSKPVLPAGLYKDRIVLITGGGTGLGFACAKKFGSLGATVAITGRRESVLQDSKREIEAAGSPKVLAIPMDVRNPASVKEGVDKIVAECGRPPCVVLNNAAGNFVSPSERLSPNAWKTVVDIVLMGTIYVTTDVAKRWIALRPKDGEPSDAGYQPQVVFMQVGASYIERGAPFLAPSSAAKSAVYNLTQSLAVEWGKYNIRSVMITPGPIYTKGAFDRLDPTGSMIGKAKKLQPLQRLGTTDEYANLVTFVCSPLGNWISGTNIYFDGASAAAGGEFTTLRGLPMQAWDAMEKQIRGSNAQDQARRRARAASKL